MQLQVDSIVKETEDVVSLVLVDPSGADLPAWEPGAHIDLVLDDHMVRQYSLNSDPADRGRYRIGVMLEEAGRGGSQRVHTAVAAGDLIEVRGPKNHFPLEEAGRYLFIAGGIGVTPTLPMVAAADRAGVPFRLEYLSRKRARMAYTDELGRYGSSVVLHPRDEEERVDVAALIATVTAGTLVYCCGPESLLAAVEAAAAGLGPDVLHVERFVTPPSTADADGEAVVDFDAERPFEVELAQSGQTLTVGSDQTTLEVLEAAGADVYSDCREGICSTCETVVLSGIPDHRDHVLSAKERESGKVMMVCVSRALSERLVLDL